MCLKKLKNYFKESRDYKRLKSRRDCLSNKYNEELKRKPNLTDGIIQTRNINMERQKRLKEYNNEIEKLNKDIRAFEWKKKEIKKKMSAMFKDYMWPLLIVIFSVLLGFILGRKC